MSTDLSLFSATELVHGFARGTLSPVEATEAALNKIDRYNDTYNAFILVDRDGALAAAKASEKRWKDKSPLGLIDGVPTSIKDLSLTKGWPTLRGSKTTDPAGPWEEDAPYVARMREHGAVFLGKTTTPEFGWKGVTDSPLTGITRNPWDPTKTPGGSSGGAAVACATGMGALHQGSDGGGSVRMPCGFTGIYGIKATFGRVPVYPASPFGTLSNIGPMTRTVADAALMLTVMSEPDLRDWYALPHDNTDWRQALSQSIKGYRIAFSPDLGHAKVDPDVAALVRTAAESFEELGAHVETHDPGIGDTSEIFRIFWYSGAASVYRGLTAEQQAMLDPGLREVCEVGSEITLAEFQDATKAREAFGQRLNAMFSEYDLLLTPTLPITAFEAGEEVPVGSGMNRWPEWTPFSHPFNLSRHPAATIPCGRCPDGLPAGLQILSAHHREDKVIAASRAYETGHPIELPPVG